MSPSQPAGDRSHSYTCASKNQFCLPRSPSCLLVSPSPVFFRTVLYFKQVFQLTSNQFRFRLTFTCCPNNRLSRVRDKQPMPTTATRRADIYTSCVTQDYRVKIMQILFPSHLISITHIPVHNLQQDCCHTRRCDGSFSYASFADSSNCLVYLAHPTWMTDRPGGIGMMARSDARRGMSGGGTRQSIHRTIP